MNDPAAQLELVRKALTSGLSNCVEWVSDNVQRRIHKDTALVPLTPRLITRLVIEHAKNGGTISQRKEDREVWKDLREFWYFVVVPAEGFPRGLFVEMELQDDDPDVPVVILLNAHPQLE
jgi:hypothetical protein